MSSNPKANDMNGLAAFGGPKLAMLAFHIFSSGILNGTTSTLFTGSG